MGRKTVINSDWNGKQITDPAIEPATITITKAGETAKDARSFEVYMTDDDVEALVANLEDDDSYLHHERLATSSSPKFSAVNTGRKMASDPRFEGFKQELERELIQTSEDKAHEDAWFNTQWTSVKDSKGAIRKLIEEASDEQLTNISASLGDGSKQYLLTILNRANRGPNPAITKIARHLMNEPLPS